MHCIHIFKCSIYTTEKLHICRNIYYCPRTLFETKEATLLGKTLYQYSRTGNGIEESYIRYNVHYSILYFEYEFRRTRYKKYLPVPVVPVIVLLIYFPLQINILTWMGDAKKNGTFKFVHGTPQRNEVKIQH